MSRRQKLTQLAWREYLPMGLTIAMWAIIVAAIGHADTARLIAAFAMVRSTQMITKLATQVGLKRRQGAPRPVRRQAKKLAFATQGVALVVALLLVALLFEALKAIGQQKVAAFIPYLALAMPARNLRFADVKSASPYSRLALSASGLALAAIGWVAGWQAALMGLAFGTREWVALAALRWWPREARPPRNPTVEPLLFAEVARTTAVMGRRLLTYRLTKSLLAPFGPIGNVAARTGRGFNLHQKLEPYIPHHLVGFILFSLATFGGAIFLALRSGEPAAMVGAAGLAQIGAATANVVLLWRYLPTRDADMVVEDDDDDD